MKRRTFLLAGAKIAAGFVLTQAAPALAALPATLFGKNESRALSFYHTHTHERLDVSYVRAGRYDPVALNRINTYLSDFRTSEVYPIDPALLDILWAMQQEMGCSSTYEIISGYRSPAR